LARVRNPNRDKSFELYKEHDGKISPNQIADILNEKVENIYKWKSTDKWDLNLQKRVGAPKGNNNASGNGAPEGNGNAKKRKSPGAPKGNLNNLKHGIYADESKRLSDDFLKKYFPTGLRSTYYDVVGFTELEKLGYSIDILWAKILRSQKIIEVKNKKDLTKELKRIKESGGPTSSSEEKEYEIQFAWDKENSALDIQSKAMERLSNMIKNYEELVHKNWDLATEEQKLKIDKLRAEISNMSGGGEGQSKEGIQEFIQATTMSEEDVNNLFKDDENGEEEETD